MRLGKRTNATSAQLGVILGSEVVSLCIVLIDEVGKPRIVFESGAPIDLSGSAGTPRAALERALKAACDELIAEGLPHIVSAQIARGEFDSINVFYGAPWYIARGRKITIERADEAPLTEKALHDLVATYVDGLLPTEMRGALILEEHAQSFTINGYPVEHPIGKTGKELGMRLFVSAVDVATKDAVERILHRSFHSKTTAHRSALLSAVRALSRFKKNDDPYLLVEVSGHLTEISKVERGIVIETVSVPHGFEATTMRTARRLKRRPEEVRTLAQRPHDFGLTAEFDTARDDALSAWGDDYAAALATLGTGTPAMTLLIADTPLQDAFKREITRTAGGAVYPISKEAYLSFYDPSARSSARTMTGLLALALGAMR